MPVRKIPKNYRSVTGRVASEKTVVGSAEFESSLERDLLTLVTFDVNVARVEEQPVEIEYRDPDGRRRTYTPDVLITYRSDILPAREMTPVLAEVKYRKDLFADWKALKPKLKAGRAYAREQGWRFRIFTEREIRTPFLANARFLLRYLRLPLDYEQSELLLDRMRELREADPDSLLLACFCDPLNRAQLTPMMWHLVAIGMIGCDLNLPLTMQSRIWTIPD